MQNDGYQQKCDEVRLLREANTLYKDALTVVVNEQYPDQALFAAAEALKKGDGVERRIPVIEIVDVVAPLVPVDNVYRLNPEY